MLDTATKAQLLRKTGLALLMALALLGLIVLPAEYGIDPSGFGGLTGLTALSNPRPSKVTEAPTATNQVEEKSEDNTDGDQPFPTGRANIHDTPPSTRSFRIDLGYLDEVEYKAVLVAGETMFYSWRVESGEDTYFDFHGDPTEGEFPEEYSQSYHEGEGPDSQGSFTATFTGNHGWYWLNISDNDITITLQVTGYYRSVEEIYRGNQMDRYR